MEYKVESLSPVKTRVDITASAAEVDAALAAALAVYKNQLKMDGFRKGKVPANLVEKRFHDQIYNEARQDLFNAHINQIIENLDAHPVSGIVINGDDKPIERGKEFDYSLEFEVLPKIDLPNYKGLEAEQEKTVLEPEASKKMLERLREMSAKLKPVDGIEPAKDGQVAVITFSGAEPGSDAPYISASDFELELGADEALPEFEKLVKGIPVGNTAEEEISFPDDFIDPRLAGKTLKMRVTVNAVKEKDYGEFDRRIEGSKDAYDNLIKSLSDSYEREMTSVHKSAAEAKLLDQLLKMADFPVPDSMVEFERNHILAEWERSLARQGKNLAALGKSEDELKAEAQAAAERNARGQTLLMAIANQEKLEVTDQEVAQHIYNSALQNGQKYEDIVESMRSNGLIYRLRDHMLADKGMDFVYDNAKITMVEPKPKEAGAQAEESAKAE